MATEKAVVSKSSNFSSVWLLPLIALGLGAYALVHSLVTEGPEIEIVFSTADGLEQGKTRVKYRNVDLGVVQDVRLNDTYDGVIATAKLDRQATDLLREDTRFWVVTARIGTDSITGLDTLLSGAYIEMSPGSGENGWRSFTALDNPPLTPADAAGIRVRLTTRRALSLDTGDAVLFKGFKVGRVESSDFDPVSRLVRYTAFIDAPYDKLVTTSTRFWDVSGISINASPDGVQVDMGSLESVFLGGIALGTPPGITDGRPVDGETEFRLYASFQEIVENPYIHGAYYVVSFSQSIRGLERGAPVEYRGLPIGRVERVLLRETMENALDAGLSGRGNALPVLIYLEPARLEMPDSEASLEVLRDAIERGVSQGMRASLETISLISSSKYIELDYYDNKAQDSAYLGGLTTMLDYPVIPTVESGLGQLEKQVAQILDTLSTLPLEATLDNANSAISSMNITLNSLNTLLAQEDTRNIPQEVESTLQELRATAEGLSPGSPVYERMESSLQRLNRSLYNLEVFTNTLAEQPNSVIIPADPPPDKIPGAGR